MYRFAIVAVVNPLLLVGECFGFANYKSLQVLGESQF